MLNFHTETKDSRRRWLLNAAIIFVITALVAGGLYFIFEAKYKNKIYPGIMAGGIDLSGKTPEEAKKIINKKVNRINQDGITFYYQGSKTVITPIISSFESDLAYEIINFNTEETVNSAFAFGRNDNFFVNLQNKARAAAFKEAIAFKIEINEEKILQALKSNFSQFEIPAEDAKLIYKKQSLLGGMENIQFEVREEKLGKIIDYEKGIARLKNNLARLDNGPIELFTKTDYPRIYKKDTLNIENKARKILALAPLTLKYENNEWVVSKEKLASWLTLKINPDYKTEGDKIIVSLALPDIEQYLRQEIAPKINKKPIEAKFEIKDGRVVEFRAGRDGIELNIAASLKNIDLLINKMIQYSSILYQNKERKNEVDLVVETVKSPVSTTDVNNLGIKEVIGTGESNFSGSPKNRRHNIAVGADTLNGILIKPDEEFSLLNALGEINADAGYLPELVIKGNETIPEYGGGLCQIGTTMFRAALASGLPITQRRNHSYRVSYYEPAGTDATIYDPWPDFKFINDTGNHILIQSRIEGDNLYFDFWGAKDGRIVERTEPVIYNIVKPGPTKLIETLDLPPGEKKCTERAHNGADAYFDYKVTYANGEIKEKRFYSHYVPWQEVCLIGVEELSENTENQNATTTKKVIE
jgi:vancomycin resistance protein YoaR